MKLRLLPILIASLFLALGLMESTGAVQNRLPAIRLSPDGRSFQTDNGKPYVPMGINYYRPGTGWAPQLWKKFDQEATRQDFVRMKELGVNCVRVFISYGSFYMKPGVLSEEGLNKFDQFLALAEETGIYVHPTGPDHWEGTPEWGRGDRYADETVLSALESYWKLFATLYRGRSVIFAYDLLNEPSVRWESKSMEPKWNRWLEKTYGTVDKLAEAWKVPAGTLQLGKITAPAAKDDPASRQLLDYQLFRESIADDWTRRQVTAIRAVDPKALVTVGLIQWSVPSLLPGVQHYSGFRPERQAKLLDFLEIHFYPLNKGFYEYGSTEDEVGNLGYLESVVREVAKAGKAVVIAEFGWYGGGKPTLNGGKHPAASEEQQARWCRSVVETTAGLATGWLNWGFYDHPQANDVSQLTGLLTVDGKTKAWGEEFNRLANAFSGGPPPAKPLPERPTLDWSRCITSAKDGNEFRTKYIDTYKATQNR